MDKCYTIGVLNHCIMLDIILTDPSTTSVVYDIDMKMYILTVINV